MNVQGLFVFHPCCNADSSRGDIDMGNQKNLSRRDFLKATLLSLGASIVSGIL